MRPLVKGNTNEEKIASIERVLGHMRTRMHRTVTVSTPPIPFSLFSQGVAAGSMIGAFMFPIDCALSNTTVVTEGEDFAKGVLSISILSGTEKREYSYIISAGKNSLSFKDNLKTGDRAIFTLSGADFKKAKEGQEQMTTVSAIWLSLLCDVDRRGMKHEEFLLDAVLNSPDLEVDT